MKFSMLFLTSCQSCRGKAVDSEKVERLLESLSDIESITPENCAFETLPQL